MGSGAGAPEDGEPGYPRPHVLLVEDDPSMAEMYRVKLEMDGYRVTIAGDGEAAVEIILGEPPDLVFLDLRMPRLDGIGVLTRLEAEPAADRPPVVVLSNYSEREQIERCLALGAREYLVKSRTTPARLSMRARHWLSERA